MNDNIGLINLKGSVKIELFNTKTGKMDYSVKKDNLITDFGADYIKKKCMTFFSACCKNSTNIWNITPFPNSTATSYNYNTMAVGGITLSDDNRIPSSANGVISGNITGYAGIADYNGEDLLRGVLNKNNSYLYNNNLTYTFNFANERANGVHNSLFFTPYVINPTYPIYYLTHKTNNFVRFYNNPQIQSLQFCPSDGYCYALINKSIVKFDPNDKLKEIFSTNNIAEITGDAIFAGSPDAINFYVFFGTTPTNLYLHKININTLEVVKLGSISINGGYSSSGKFNFKFSNNNLYFADKNSNNITKIDLESFKLENKTIPVSTNNNILLWEHNEGDEIRLYDDKLQQFVIYDWNSNSITGNSYKVKTMYNKMQLEFITSINYDYSRNSNLPTKYIGNNKFVILSYSENYSFNPSIQKISYPDSLITIVEIDIVDFSNYANAITHLKFDEPINKTKDQVMTISYTLNFS